MFVCLVCGGDVGCASDPSAAASASTTNSSIGVVLMIAASHEVKGQEPCETWQKAFLTWPRHHAHPHSLAALFPAQVARIHNG